MFSSSSVKASERDLTRDDILSILLEVNFKESLSDKEIKDVEKIKLKFKDIVLNKLSEEELFNLKYLVYKESLVNVEKFNGNDKLKMSHYSKIMSKTFDIESNKNNFYDVNFLIKDKNLNDKDFITSDSISELIYSDVLKSYFLNKDGNIDVSYYKLINKFLLITDNKKLSKTIVVGNESKLAEAIRDLENNDYYKYTITSTYTKSNQLQSQYNEVINKNEARHYINFHTLYNYKIHSVGKSIVFTDNKKEYTSYIYKTSLKIFIDIFNQTGNKDKSFKDIYDYVYNSIGYNANGFNYMLITNLGNGEMACNGISRLVNELLVSNGYESEIVGGNSHYWNIINIDGEKTVVDLTTDIISKKYGITLGESSKNHNKIISDLGINYYSADFKVGQERVINENLKAKNLLK